MTSLKFGALVLSIICTTSCVAFTASPAPRLLKMSRSGFPLDASKTSEATAIPNLSMGTKPVVESSIKDDDDDGDDDRNATEESSWQENLDLLFAPDTSAAERQIVLYDLLSSGDKIQESVRTALRERKVSDLLHSPCCGIFTLQLDSIS